MRNKLYKIALAVFGIALALTFSCDSSGNPSALVGRWVRVPDGNLVIELLGDGTGIFGQGTSITWKTENERIYITSGGTTSFNYKVKGSILTLTTDDGIGEYTKCHKECGEAVKEYINAKLAKIKKSLGSFADARDGKTYKTVKLDNQTWMAENLNYEIEGSKCYKNDPANCEKYGRLYYWKTALKACPNGWHLPSDEEWQTLVNLVGGESKAGNVLKSSINWDGDDNGTDALGFSALPGGGGVDSGFSFAGNRGYWWSASELNSDFADSRVCVGTEFTRWSYGNKRTVLHSVRCLQD